MSRKPALTNVEFLALAIFLDPGQSGSFYCRALYKYRCPKAKRPGRHGLTYFFMTYPSTYVDRKGHWRQAYRYPGRLWVNKPTAAANRKWRESKNDRNGPTSSWTLTPAGNAKAREALLKLEFDLDTLIEMP